MNANERYKQKMQEVKNTIKKIEIELAKHSKKQSIDKSNWGHVGSLNAVEIDLKNILEFIKQQ